MRLDSKWKEAFLLIVALLMAGCGFLQKGNSSSPGNTVNAREAPATDVNSNQKKGERGTPAEAKAMLRQAVDHYNAVGRKQALEDFNTKKPPFGDRDLYVACMGPDHRIIANGGFPEYVGSSVDGWKDVNGNSVGQASWDAAIRGEDSIKYRWINPVTHKMEPKVLYVQKVSNDVCGVGAYNPQ